MTIGRKFRLYSKKYGDWSKKSTEVCYDLIMTKSGLIINFAFFADANFTCR